MSEAHCVCNLPDDGRFMLSCDKCKKWFHGACVGQHKNKNNQQWECPLCCPLWTGKWSKKKRQTENLAPALTPKFTSPSKDLGTALYADNAKNGDAPGKQLVSHPTPKSVRKILFAYNGKAEAVDAPEREKQFSSSLTNGSLGLNLSRKRSLSLKRNSTGVNAQRPENVCQVESSLRMVPKVRIVSKTEKQSLLKKSPRSKSVLNASSDFGVPHVDLTLNSAMNGKCSKEQSEDEEFAKPILEVKRKTPSTQLTSEHESDEVLDEEISQVKRKENTMLKPTMGKCFKQQSKDESDEELDEEIFKVKKKTPSTRLTSGKAAPKLSCQYCKGTFASHPSISRHRKSCALNPERQSNLLVCMNCGRNFSRRYILTKHTEKCKEDKPMRTVSKMKCSSSACDSTFYHKTSLYDHLRLVHDTDLKPPETFVFSSFKEFKVWKTRVEDGSYSFFSQQYGKRDQAYYFYCQHDGKVKSHRKATEPERKTKRRNRKGRIKKNDLCLAMMSLKFLDDGKKIQVVYRPSHFHPCHPRDLKHQPLSDETNKFISMQLAWSVPPRKIVLNLRDDSYRRQNRFQKPNFKRDNLVKVKTITERRRKLKCASRYDQSDSTSVYMKVTALMEECYNPILVYKPYQEETVTGPAGSENLPHDVFLLAIQTEDQLKIMKEGCQTILVVDETHSTNQYGFKLLNLVVRDKFHQGYPVAHAITSKSDEHTLKYVFKAIKDRCPGIEVNCCITDDDPALINSVVAGFDKDIWHILCIWHIHRTVQANLRAHIKDNDLVDEIYKIICVIIDADSEEEFRKYLNAFLQEYTSKVQKFMKYFKDTLLPKKRKWARCFRKKYHGNVDTTMLVESFHNILKTVYLRRVPLKRLDDLLDLLLQIEEDYYVRYQNALNTECLSDHDMAEIEKRHERGEKIPTSHVVEVSNGHWQVKSQNNEDEVYNIQKTADVCNNMPCVYVCSSPACETLCSHQYFCTCPDISPLCKHIHKINLLQLKSTKLPNPVIGGKHCEEEEPPTYTVENYLPETSDASDHKKSGRDLMSSKIDSVRSILKELESELDNSPVKKHMLPRMQSVFEDLNAQCKALSHEPNNHEEMTVKIKTAPSEKLHKQLKPFIKVKRKKKKNSLERPNRQSASEVQKFLLSEAVQQFDDIDAPAQCDPMESAVAVTDTPVPTSESFSLPLTYSAPTDTILICHGVNLNLLHLKALQNSVNEVNVLRLHDSNFRPGHVYPAIINAFFSTLSACHHEVFAFNTAWAVDKRMPENIVPADHKVILFPVKVNGSWTVAAVYVDSNDIWYCNPLLHAGSSLSPLEKKFLDLIVTTVRKIFPAIATWNLKIYYDFQSKEENSGIAVCWFGYQSCDRKCTFAPLKDNFRKSLYSVLRLKCLKRNKLIDQMCCMCGKTTYLQSVAKCYRCFQCFHPACLTSEHLVGSQVVCC